MASAPMPYQCTVLNTFKFQSNLGQGRILGGARTGQIASAMPPLSVQSSTSLIQSRVIFVGLISEVSISEVRMILPEEENS